MKDLPDLLESLVKKNPQGLDTEMNFRSYNPEQIRARCIYHFLIGILIFSEHSFTQVLVVSRL